MIDERATKSVLSLLKLEAGDRCVYFVIKHFRYKGNDGPDRGDSDAYFFEEHSCPTNWLGDCLMVAEGGDTDPHGFLKFVRSVEFPRDFDDNDETTIIETFPEVLAPKGFTA